MALIVTFGWAAGAKVVRFGSWRDALVRYRLPRGVFAAALLVVPVSEATIALLLVVGLARPGGALGVALLSAFTAAIARARAITGDRVPCGCFGKLTERDYRVVLLRNSVLGVAAATVLVRGHRDSPLDGLAVPRSSELVPAVLVAVGIGVILWIGRHLSAWTREGSR